MNEKDKENQNIETAENPNILETEITSEMESTYLDYA
jgi:hypothetical protein